jgi:hypothetical protein
VNQKITSAPEVNSDSTATQPVFLRPREIAGAEVFPSMIVRVPSGPPGVSGKMPGAQIFLAATREKHLMRVRARAHTRPVTQYAALPGIAY